MSRKIGLILAVLVFLTGLGVFAYPHIEGTVLESHAAEAVESFKNTFPRETHSSTPSDPNPPEDSLILPDRYPELYKAMWEYNRTIYAERQKGLSDPWAYENSSFDLTAYGLETDVFGVLTIPALELEMPLYLGASYENMAKGAAHLSQTSLPIGGSNTNCVIAGHRGWSGAPYFLHLDRLAVGDRVAITNLWETLEYEVTGIRIIEPNAVNEILIKEGRELLTLMTCHPPNSGGRFRYLVICERAKESVPP
ncbi:MAG: class C sortase [Oscillospiraceae bacterium]|nr:class C sortase [Oscillospiraceae bacterium]